MFPVTLGGILKQGGDPNSSNIFLEVENNYFLSNKKFAIFKLRDYHLNI